MDFESSTHVEIARTNARILMADSTAKTFCDRVGMSESQVSQLLGKNPSKNIGPTLARRIEQAFGKPRGWLDIPHVDVAVPSSKSIGDRLDQAMTAARFESQASLARASGVPQPTISRILKNAPGKQGPEMETLKRLAQACGVSLKWLNEGSTEEDAQDVQFTGEQREWLALLDDLGSADIAEFKTLIRERQRRNRQLVNELIKKKKAA
jgi:transcriptional regulator with XRE-family HTH domain